MSSVAVTTSSARLRIRPFRDLNTRRRRYDRYGEDYVSRFFRLLRKWRAETGYSSSPHEMFSHQAFVEIVGMGEKVVPLIISEVRRQPDWIIGALVQITGENPIADIDRGDLYAMATAWIEWFHRRT